MFKTYYSFYKVNIYSKGVYYRTSFNLRFYKFSFTKDKTIYLTLKKYPNKFYNLCSKLVYINYLFQNKFVLLKKKKFNLHEQLLALFGVCKSLKNITNYFHIEIS